MGQTLVLQCPGAVKGTGFRKLENYVGIEFKRNASDNGGYAGYNKMIGDEELLETLPLFNQIKTALVKNASVTSVLNQLNWNKTEGGADVNLACPDGSDVMVTYPTMYAIIGGSNPTYERFIFSDAPFSYDGEEAEEIKAWGEAPDYEVILNGIARSVYGAGVTATNDTTDSKWGTNNLYGTALGFPTVSTSRYGFEGAARAKNSNTASNMPYCNGNMLDWEVILGMLYVECRTKDITSVFGHGISSNVTPTAANWGNVSGIHCIDEGNTDKYFSFGQPVYGVLGQIGTTSTVSKNWVDILAYKFLPAMGGQIAVSSDSSVLESVTDADGRPIQGKANGVMTGIITQRVTFKLVCALTNGGEIGTHNFEMILKIPVWRGRTALYGQIWSHLSGYEAVNYKDSEGVFHNILYRAKSIEGIDTDTNETIAAQEAGWNFTSLYERIGDIGAPNEWCKDSISNGKRSLAIAKTAGAAINNYQCAHTWTDITATYNTGEYRRKTAGLLGGSATHGACVPRYVFANSAPSLATARNGSRFRVALN